MTEAQATGFDPAKLPAGLLSQEIVKTRTFAPEEVTRAWSFEEGQISGPFGPRFVGYGERPQVPLCRYIVQWTTALSIGALIAMMAL